MQFGEPEPIPNTLPPVLPFDYELLPDRLRPRAQDIAERMQCPADYPAAALMTATSSVVGRQVGIRPYQHDDWTVAPNLWGGAIGRSGAMKTPGIQEALSSLQRLEVRGKDQYDEALKEYEAQKLVEGQRRKRAEAKILEHLEKSEEDAEARAREVISRTCEPPTRRRHVVNDSTVEKLGETLRENPNGVLVYRDELAGLLQSLEKEGQQGARAFYLEAWSGTGRFTYDRIGRGVVDIECAIVSVFGGIQPGPLSHYLRNTLNEAVGDDGLIQRFQLMVWPDPIREWRKVDRAPDLEARAVADRVFEELSALDLESIRAERDADDSDGIPFLRFSAEGQAAFDLWRQELEEVVRSGEEHPAIESHLAKYRSLVPSLALLLHLADGARGPVAAVAVEKAIAWSRYLESHARRIYSLAIDRNLTAAKALGRKLVQRRLKDGFSLREVYQQGWTGLSLRDDAAAAVDVLVDYGWVISTQERTTGRSRTQHWINPKIHEVPPTGAGKTGKSPSGGFAGSPGGPSREQISRTPSQKGSARRPDGAMHSADGTAPGQLPEEDP